MKFRTKDLANYFASKKINWKYVAETLTLKSCETIWNGKELEADILPNLYPYLASLVGLSKEIGVIAGYKPKEPKLKIVENQKKITQVLQVEVKTPACTHYFARVILDLKNEKSPKWLQDFVKAYGFNSINFLVDLSNFVMIEYGAPLHIFDLDKLKGKLIVREAEEQENFHALNNQYYLLPKGAVVMSDDKGVFDLVGIIGGARPMVDLSTKNILVQSPIVSSDRIYEVSRAIRFKTDASSRFERGVAPINASVGLERLISLIQYHLGGKVLQGRLQRGEIKKWRVVLNMKQLNEIWGEYISRNDIENHLRKSAIKVIKKTKDGYYLEPPAYRLDLTTEEEVIEEIVRLHGFNQLKSKPPIGFQLGREDEQLEFIDLLKQIAVSAGFDEAINYSFTSQPELDLFAGVFKTIFPKDKYQLIPALNPISNLYEVYRPSLLPGLLRTCKTNQRLSRELRFFEIGHIALQVDRDVNETLHFGAVILSDQLRDALLEIKGFVSMLLEKVGATDLRFKDSTLEGFEVGGVIHGLKEEVIGYLGLLDKKISSHYDLDKRVVVVEIAIEKLADNLRKEMEFEALPTFPAVLRDLSFIVSETTSIDFIEKSIQDLCGEFLEDIEIVDIYQGEGIKDDQKAITLRLIFRSKNRSLKDEEVNMLMQKITKDLVYNFKASLR